MVNPNELQWVHPPLQERSQQTMERLLAAAEELIGEVGFEKATVAGIAKRAESSVGAFYARFKDKDALLRCLLERFVRDALATITSALRPSLWASSSIEELSRTLIRFMMQVLSERQQLMRAISELTMHEAELASFREHLCAHAAECLQTLLHSRGEVLGCSDPARALRVVAWTGLSLFEASALGGQRLAGLTRDELSEELSTMILCYLQVDSTQQGRAT